MYVYMTNTVHKKKSANKYENMTLGCYRMPFASLTSPLLFFLLYSLKLNFTLNRLITMNVL